MILGTFIIDFQTVNFEPDAKIARELLMGLQEKCQLENAFALDEPVQSAGWSFAKMFLSGQFAEKIYALNAYEIDGMKGKKIEDRLIAWLGARLKEMRCNAQVKMAPEMKA